MITHTLLPDHRIDREARSLAEKGYDMYIICTGLKREAPGVYAKIYTIPLSNKEKSFSYTSPISFNLFTINFAMSKYPWKSFG